MNADATGPETIVRWLDGRPGTADDLGGKGCGLNRLAALGAPVPLAAVIPASVYRWFATTNDLPLTVAALDATDPAAIQRAIRHLPLPETVATALRHAAQVFSVQSNGRPPAVAVRSSATSEDGAECAFAGLHDSLLNVDPASGLEAAIRHCWASLWSERAVSYRIEQGLQRVQCEMAVVIQQMVYSDVSFVAFAADPISGDRDTVLITASWGLCEALVSGVVVPDEIRVDRNGQVVEYQVGTKHEMVIPSDAGVTTVPVPRLLQAQPVMNVETAEGIASTVRRLSTGLGYPADVEGGIEHGNLQFFQARPITTLPKVSTSSISARSEEMYPHVESGHHSAG